MDNEVIFRLAELGVFLLSVAGLLYRLGGMTARFELIGAQQAVEIKELKDSIKEIQKVITAQALTTQRLDTIDARVLAEGQRLDKLSDQYTRMELVVSSHPYGNK